MTKLERAFVAVEGAVTPPLLPVSEITAVGLADRLREATKEVHKAVMMPAIVQYVSFPSIPAVAIFERKDALSSRQRKKEADS